MFSIRLIATASLILALGGCQKYSVSINDKVVYTPPAVFKDYQLADAKLATCVEQTIFDQHAASVDEIKTLNCSNAGITSLVGLETFYALEALNLADNNIQSIQPLAKNARLKVLILSHNNINDPAPLLNLLHLTQLNLDNNPITNCDLLAQLKRNLAAQKATIISPTECS